MRRVAVGFLCCLAILILLQLTIKFDINFANIEFCKIILNPLKKTELCEHKIKKERHPLIYRKKHIILTLINN